MSPWYEKPNSIYLKISPPLKSQTGKQTFPLVSANKEYTRNNFNEKYKRTVHSKGLNIENKVCYTIKDSP